MTIAQPLLPQQQSPLAQADAQGQGYLAHAGMGPMDDEQMEGEEIDPFEIKDPTGGQDPIVKEASKNPATTVEYILRIFNKYRQERLRTVEMSWEISDRLYKGEFRDNFWPYSTVYEIREVYRQVEAMKALTFQGFFGQPKRFEYKTLHAGGEDAANIATHIVERQLRVLGNEDEIYKWHNEPYVKGIAYLQYGWARYKRLKHKNTNMHQSEKDLGKRDVEEAMNEGPFLEWQDCWKVYTNPWVDDIQDSPFVFIREIVSGEYLRTMVNEGRFDKKAVMKALDKGGTANSYAPEDNRVWLASDPGIFGDDKEFKLLTAWTNTGWTYAVVEDEFFVMAQRNPFDRVPILNLRNNPEPGLHYGTSEPTILAAEQMLLRDVASMWVDSIHYKLQPMWVIKEYLKNQWENTGFRPGATNYVTNMEDIKPLAGGPDTLFNLENAMNLIRMSMQRTTGMTDEVTGEGSRHRTASGMQMLQQAASARTEMKLMQWAPIMSKLYGKAYELNAAYMSKDVAARVEGLDGKLQIGRYDSGNFSPEVDVEVILPRNMMPPEAQQSKAILLYNSTKMDPLVNKEPVILELARAFQLTNPKRLLANRMTSQRDAVYENQDFQTTGFIQDPVATEDHVMHYQIHYAYKHTPEFLALPPETQVLMHMHCSIHEAYLKAMQQMPGAPAQPMGGEGPMPGAEGNMMGNAMGNEMGEDMFNNGARGAEQQGVPGNVIQMRAAR